ncbi:DL-endopeptidase inhibitor IseA family protein [Desulfuribacillus alkaliarsenatis]|uniref:Uncharacterized protein n=1 Tax=Desulfuribacillus alkaliarsenatis TaxID=766136 RepID=A0A1E5FYT0_9FIRM|nr:DL-endopeptidase inhibitor IseA family protein [Desulfuribacillus alkaliarsenatis]OEF95720.1 hypothetical protein BHF68_11480 [Desulfuribacillus alkaliarsenatis]
MSIIDMKRRIVYLTIIAMLSIALGLLYSNYKSLQQTISNYDETEMKDSVDGLSRGNADEVQRKEFTDDMNRSGLFGNDSEALLSEFRAITLAEWQLRSYPYTANEIVKDLVVRTDLIPYESVPGGSMFFDPDKVILLTHNWAVAYFEDGHIHGFLLLKYGIDQRNQLTWTVIDSWIPQGIDYESKLLTDKEVVRLISEASERHWSTMFDYDDAEEELLAYLQEVYTVEVSQQLLASYNFKTLEGRLFFENGKQGTLYAWHQAEAALLYHKQDRALYSVTVPVGDGYYEEKQIELVYLLNRGWRVNTIIDY